MLRLIPVLKDYIWGGRKLNELYGRENSGNRISESWEVSVHPDGLSLCEGGGTLAAYLQAHPEAVNRNGDSLPVLIKYIDAAQNLSIQVHPDNSYARLCGYENGKTELWYVIHAAEGAGIYCGFRTDVDKETFLKKVKDGSVEECLNFIPVKDGDCYLIKAGTVHSIGAGCVICEIQQSCNVTYRVYDYNRCGGDGRPRKLHIEQAMDVINFSAFRDETGRSAPHPVEGGSMRLLTQCEYFRCRELSLDGSYSERAADSFLAVSVVEGNGRADKDVFRAGDSFFVPCGESLSLSGKAKIILTDLPNP